MQRWISRWVFFLLIVSFVRDLCYLCFLICCCLFFHGLFIYFYVSCPSRIHIDNVEEKMKISQQNDEKKTNLTSAQQFMEWLWMRTNMQMAECIKFQTERVILIISNSIIIIRSSIHPHHWINISIRISICGRIFFFSDGMQSNESHGFSDWSELQI